MAVTRETLLVWDNENYELEEAIKDGAITRVVIPRHLNTLGKQAYIAGFVEALKAAGDRTCNYPEKLKHTVITETLHSVCVEVLEWNTYDFNVWSSNPEDARQIALAEGVSLEHSDVTYGSSNYDADESTHDRLVN